MTDQLALLEQVGLIANAVEYGDQKRLAAALAASLTILDKLGAESTSLQPTEILHNVLDGDYNTALEGVLLLASEALNYTREDLT